MSGSLWSSFVPQAEAAESGGDPGAQNPNSSASGILQFTTPTWNSTVQKYGDRYGLTLDGKNNSRQQELGAKALIDNEYTPWFQSKGVDPNTTDIYQMHFWGQPAMEKMMAAPGAAKLTDVLGPGAYTANKGLFGNNPNVTVTDATNAVAAHFNKNGLQNQQVASLPVPPGAPQAQATPQDLPQGDPMSGSMNLPPSMMAQQAPQMPDPNAAPNPWSPMNMLRMAAGMGQGPNISTGMAGAANALVQGQQQDFQNQMGQQDYRLKQQQANASIMGEASKLMEMGVPPPLAIGITSGQIPAGQAQQALQNMTATGGRGTKGDTYLTPDGHTIQETQRPFGKPTLTDLQTGQVIPNLPVGAYRSQDAYVKSLQGGEGAAENAAINGAMQAPKTLAQLDSLKDLVPQIATGQDLLSTVRRNFTNLTGLPLGGNDATAQNLAQNTMDQLKVARMGLLKGYGRVDLPMVKAVQAAGPNWMQNPDALNAVIEYSKIEPTRQMQTVKDWNAAQANGQGGMGYRKFAMNWEDQHPMEADVRSALAFPTSQSNPGTPQPGPSAAGVIRYDAKGNRSQ